MPVGSDLAERLAALTPAQRQLLWERLGPMAAVGASAGDAGAARRSAGEVSPRRPDAPLSLAQERLWLADRLRPASPMHNLAFALHLSGELDEGALGRSLAEIIRRHEPLRTTFAEDGGRPHQVIGPAGDLDAVAPLPVTRLTAPPANREAELGCLLREEAHRLFDLRQGPLLRAALFRVTEREHTLLIVVHHIAFDAWSQAVFLRELAALYDAFSAGQASPLPDLPCRYTDFALWQRGRLDGVARLAYWREHLRGAPQLELPADRPRPAALSGRGAAERFAIPAEIAIGLRELGRGRGATLFATLLAGFMVLLHRLSGQADIVVAAPAASRRRAEFAGLIGCFLDILPLRAGLSGNPRFTDLLAQVQEEVASAFAHGDAPFERVAEAAQSPAHASLARTMFVMRPATPAPVFTGISAAVEMLTIERSEFDLTLDVTEDSAGGLTAALEYSTDLFDPPTIRRMAGHFGVLLAGVIAHPARRIGALPLLTAAERREILAMGNPTRDTFLQFAAPDRGSALPIHRLFEDRASQQPDAVAVIAGGAARTYQQLNRRANRIAWRLRSMGVGPETIVGLCVERSFEMIAALLGILKAGGAYLPLETPHAAELATTRKPRALRLLREAGAAALLTTRRLAGRLSAHRGPTLILDAEPDERAAGEVDLDPGDVSTPDALAYVIFTSGSTGQPKGVMIEHRSLTCFTRWAGAAYGLAPGDRVLQFHSLAFDASVEEIFPCLISGATLVLRSETMIASPAHFWQEMAGQGVTVVSLPTSHWRRLAPAVEHASDAEIGASSAAAAPSLRLMIIGGEQPQPEALGRWQAWLAPGVRLINTYGPTEATVVATAYEITRWPTAGSPGRVPIGRPLPHVHAYVLDGYGNPCPVGAPGELCLAGEGLARGYLHSPDLTAARFIPNPFANASGARLYRTGDLAYYLPDGNLAFMGRLDRQLKVRGYRIEPAEIEGALLQHPAVADAWVTAQADASGDLHLVAYVAPRVEGLAKWLAGRLPPQMAPAAFVLLDALPSLPNGKLDRAALPPADLTTAIAAQGAPDRRAPRTSTEELAGGIMASVLGLPEIHRDDDFFALGGHSLLAAQVIARLGEAFAVDLPLAALFEFPTAAGLAAAAERAQRDLPQRATVIPLVPQPGDGAAVPLSPAQARIWRAARALPRAPLFVMPTLLRLDGPLDFGALEQGLAEITRRHRILAAIVVERDGRAEMSPQPPAPFSLPVVDLRDLPASDHDALIRQLAVEELSRPFDLCAGPPLRAILAWLAPDRYALCLTLHHIAADGGSVAILVEEMAAIYAAFAENRPLPLPDPAAQYSDWVRWQGQWMESEPAQAQLAYWLKRLGGALTPLDLSNTRPHSIRRTYRYARQGHLLPPPLAEALRRLSRAHDVTLFMALLAGVKTLLHHYSGQSDIRVGTVVANRSRPETGRMVGLLANTVILRTELDGAMSGRELLRRVRRTTLEAYANQDLPFEMLLEALARQHDLAHEAPFQVLLVFQNNPAQPCQAAGLSIQPVADEVAAGEHEFTLSTFDWIIEANPQPEGIALSLRYNADLFERDFICAALQHLEECLVHLTAHPDRPLWAPQPRPPAEKSGTP